MGALRDWMKHRLRRAGVARDAASYWRRRVRARGLEEPELALLPHLCRPGSVLVDVGANYGMYTFWLRALGRCVAFEAQPALADCLRRGFGASVQVHAVGLSDAPGRATLRMARQSPGLSTISPANALDATAGALTIPTKTLDSFELGDVSFIKIDVEGHEEAVLRGAAQTLARTQPAILAEVEERHNQGSVARVFSLLESHGYRPAALRGDTLVAVTAEEVTALQLEDPAGAPRNFVFAPSTRGDELIGLRPDPRALLDRLGEAARSTP